MLELVRYREWTETLGEDREWKIQTFQNGFLAKLHEVSASFNSFVITKDFNRYFFFVDNVDVKGLKGSLYSIESPVEVNLCESYGDSVKEAIRNSTLCRKEEGEDEEVVTIHLDYDYSTKERMWWRSISRVKAVAERIARASMGVWYYLGGDNFVVFTNLKGLARAQGELRGLDVIKAGIGIGKTAREALKGSAEALKELRARRDKRVEVVHA